MRVNKRFKEQINKFIYQGQEVPLSLGTLCVVMLCLLALVVATFTHINLSHWWVVRNPDNTFMNVMKYYPYVPQIPILLGTVGLLGVRFSFLTVLLYVLMGFFLWPVFAFGGGLEYIKSTFFGYILGYFPAVIIAGRILLRGKSLKNMVLAAFFGVLTIHLCGIFYALILFLFKVVEFQYVFAPIMTQRGETLCYDWFISIAAIALSVPLKYLLWVAMDSGLTKKVTGTIKKRVAKL